MRFASTSSPGRAGGATNATDTSPGTSGGDDALLGQIARGSEEAMGLLYARHARTVFGIASQSVDSATAEEIVQDVFLSVWRGASSFDPSRGAAKAWLFQIARNRIANELRGRGRRPRTDGGGDETLSALPDPSPDQAESFWTKYRGETLKRALRSLPRPERAALGLAYFEELPHRELAAHLGIPLGTAKSRIRSGVDRLRGRLAPLVASVALTILAAAVAWRVQHARTDMARNERALTMLTSSDAVALRLGAAPGQPADAHATYRFRPGSPIAVVTYSNFPAAVPGRSDRAWAFAGGRWILLGEAAPDASGRARLIAEDPALAAAPERLIVTREQGPSRGTPVGETLVRWEADRK